MTFEEKLIQLRKARGLSQEDLAEQLGVSRQAVSRWESGSTTPDMPNLVQLCKLFEVSADYLIHDDYAEEKKEKRENKETGNVTSEEKERIRAEWMRRYIQYRILLGYTVGFGCNAFFTGLMTIVSRSEVLAGMTLCWTVSFVIMLVLFVVSKIRLDEVK